MTYGPLKWPIIAHVWSERYDMHIYLSTAFYSAVRLVPRRFLDSGAILSQTISYRSILRFKSTVWSAQITREIFALLKSNAPSAQTTKVFLVLKATREVRRINWRIGQPLQSVRVRKTHFYIKFCRHFYRNDGPFNSSDIKLDSNPLITNY